ncbi:MAG: penicillin-binding protein 2 [Alphaproteobacteria bacterium]|nr:penicillin-binding protein 2 [Alphaproteobacteria bacterium]
MFQVDYDFSEKIFSRRAFVIGGLQFFGLSVLAGRLAWLQIAQGKQYKTLSDKNRINIKILAPSRGQIVDRFGVPLAINTENYRVLVIPEQTQDIENSLKVLQEFVFVEESDIERVLKESKKSSKFIPLTIKEDLTWDEVARIEVNLPDLPGLFIDVGERRTYPYGQATAHVVGYVRDVAKEDLEDNDPMLRIPGFKIGKTGVEKVFDDEIRGEAGAVEVEVNVVGREVRELRRQNAVRGDRVTLTLDGELQRYTQEVLSQHRSASAIVMDAITGAIYSMASHPSFDPENFVRGLSREKWEAMMDDPGLPQTNKVIAGLYPPGSTFKMVTALAGLEAGVISKYTTAFCPGYYKLGRDKFHCWKKEGHGTVNLDSALAESCDVYFYKMSTDVGMEKIADMSRRFGLGATLDFEITGEKPGLITDKHWKRETFGKPWYPGETIVSSIGQGDIRTTPLQLAVMTARMVNGGYAVKPWVTGYVGNRSITQSTLERVAVSEEHLKAVLKGMDMVVNSPRGTAYASRITNPEWKMGGKTGTAQVRRITKEQRLLGVRNEDLPWEQRHHALFVGYAPVESPRYVCSVVVEHGVGGSKAAAPLAQALLERVQQRNPAATKMQPEFNEITDATAQPASIVTNKNFLGEWE